MRNPFLLPLPLLLLHLTITTARLIPQADQLNPAASSQPQPQLQLPPNLLPLPPGFDPSACSRAPTNDWKDSTITPDSPFPPANPDDSDITYVTQAVPAPLAARTTSIIDPSFTGAIVGNPLPSSPPPTSPPPPPPPPPPTLNTTNPNTPCIQIARFPFHSARGFIRTPDKYLTPGRPYFYSWTADGDLESIMHYRPQSGAKGVYQRVSIEPRYSSRGGVVLPLLSGGGSGGPDMRLFAGGGGGGGGGRGGGGGGGGGSGEGEVGEGAGVGGEEGAGVGAPERYWMSMEVSLQTRTVGGLTGELALFTVNLRPPAVVHQGEGEGTGDEDEVQGAVAVD